MFAIYGTSGLMYRGLAEDLRRVVPTLRSVRTRALEPEFDRPLTLPDADAGAARHAEHRGSAHALSSYSQLQRAPQARRALRTVDDVMSRKPIALKHDMTVRQGWWTLYRRGVGQAPVLDRNGMIIGLLTRAELMQPERLPTPDGHALVWQALMAQPVTEVMISPVPAVSAQADLRRLALVLLDTGLQGLPVVDAEGRLEGFVTRSDILKAVVHDPPLDLWAG